VSHVQKPTAETFAVDGPHVQTGLAWNPKDLTLFVGPEIIVISLPPAVRFTFASSADILEDDKDYRLQNSTMHASRNHSDGQTRDIAVCYL
jgi:hypothetical protein